MTKVSRHSVDPELVEEGMERKAKLLRDLVDDETIRAEGLSIVLGTARSYAGYIAAVGGDETELCRALRIGAQTAAGIFALGTGRGDMEIVIGERRERLTATGPSDATHVGHWRIGWWLANIVGDRDVIATLLATPIDLLRRSSSRADECQYLFAETLQAFERRDDDWSTKLQAAVDATDPARMPIADEDFVLNVLVPEMQMLYRLAVGEIQPFVDATEFALERHKKYWTKAARKRDPDGYLALGALAILAIGRDAGITIQTDSDYTPQAIIDGACRTKGN